MKSKMFIPVNMLQSVRFCSVLLLIFLFSTLYADVPDSPSQPELTAVSCTVLSASWVAPANDGGQPIIQYLIRFWKDPGGVPANIFSTATSCTITGLEPATHYIVQIYAQNSLGWGPPSPSSEKSTLDIAPSIISLVADDPDNGDLTFSNGDRLTINFDKDTNEPLAGTKAAIDALLTFSSPLGSGYSGTWSDSKTLQIIVTDITSGSPVIGITTVQVKASGALKNAAETSEVCTAVSSPLSGDWGDGSLPVKLSCFTAIANPPNIMLEWITEYEDENWGFILERKENNETQWKTIASYITHPKLRGRGNSSIHNTYKFVDVSADYQKLYTYRISDVQIDGIKSHICCYEYMPESTVNRFMLEPVFPNPFNSSTQICYSLAEPNFVVLEIYDVLGRKIKTLISANQGTGKHSLFWNGKNESGFDVASGNYIVVLDASGEVRSQKILLVR